MLTKQECREIEQKAFYITKGIVLNICIVVFLMWFIGFLINLFVFFDVDDTDKDKWSRSNVELITDYGTGVQYLYKGGCLIPRIDSEGKIITIKVKHKK